MDPVETSLLYLSSRQRTDAGADNNAEFEVVTPNSVHTQSIVEVCPVQISFPNLFDNVAKTATFDVVYEGSADFTFTSLTKLFQITQLTATSVGFATPQVDYYIAAGTYSRKQILEHMVAFSNPNFKFTYNLGVATFTYNNDASSLGPGAFFDAMEFEIKEPLYQALENDKNLSGDVVTSLSGLTQSATNTSTYSAGVHHVTVTAGHYTAIELAGLLESQASAGGPYAWDVVDDQLVLDLGSGHHRELTIVQTSTEALSVIDSFDFYKRHTPAAGTAGLFQFGRLNLHPLSNVFVAVSNLAASTFTHGGTGHLYDILCCIPVGRYGYGNLVYWEPSDQGLARLRLPRSTIHDRVKITLLDDNLNPLYLDRHYHVDIVMKIYNSNHGHSTGRI